MKSNPRNLVRFRSVAIAVDPVVRKCSTSGVVPRHEQRVERAMDGGCLVLPDRGSCQSILELAPPHARPLAARNLERPAQETWWAVEDLWLRLAMRTSVFVETEGDHPCVVVTDLAQAFDGAIGQLRRYVLDAATYAWRTEGNRGGFVTQFGYRGDDLVLTLSTLRVIKTWPDGPDLIWQVTGLLWRLQQMASAGRTSTGRIEVDARRP